jgi:Na+/pantothenate symporter
MVVGITLAASIASTATFVINPGFVYQHGLSAYLHFGVAGVPGHSHRLPGADPRLPAPRREQHAALTIPQWIFYRYNHRGFSLFFAFINLLSITFVVLILVGCSLLVTGLFPVEQKTALVLGAAVRLLLRADGRHLRPRLHQHAAGGDDAAASSCRSVRCRATSTSAATPQAALQARR